MQNLQKLTINKNFKTKFRVLSIKKSLEFKKIGKKGAKFYSKTLILICAPSNNDYSYNPNQGQNAVSFCRVGYTVSKKIGNAVKRNYAKRRLRQSFLALKDFAKENYDYVIIARKDISDANFTKILSDLKFCLKNIHNLKK